MRLDRAQGGDDILRRGKIGLKEMLVRETLTRDEIDLMERVLDSERDKLVVRIFGDCGLRLDELTQLTPRSIIRSGRQAHLRVVGKGSRLRDVPLATRRESLMKPHRATL